jgi:hypothetical protein
MKIEFIPASKEVELLVEPPRPAKLLIPDWYKKSIPFDFKKPVFENNQIANTGVKMCMPFFDATSGGYIQKTWTDIHIEPQDDGSVDYRYAQYPEILGHRDKVSVDIGSGYYNVEFIWKRQWTVRLPKNYSILITHPHNRLDLPFTTLSGLVDSDKFYHTSIGSIPFYIKKEFKGFIPAGTPMYQIIPVKRESWESEIVEFNEVDNLKLNHKIKSKFYGAYREMFWTKKEYR